MEGSTSIQIGLQKGCWDGKALTLIAEYAKIQADQFSLDVDYRPTGRSWRTESVQHDRLATVGIDHPLDAALRNGRKSAWKAKNPDALALPVIRGKPNRRASEPSYKNASIMISEVVVLCHIEMLPALPMYDPWPAGMTVDDMAIGENLVPSNQNAGTEPNLIAVGVWNLDLVDSRFSAVGIGVCIGNIDA